MTHSSDMQKQERQNQGRVPEDHRDWTPMSAAGSSKWWKAKRTDGYVELRWRNCGKERLAKKYPHAPSAEHCTQSDSETVWHDRSHLFQRQTKQYGSPGATNTRTGQRRSGEKFCGTTSPHLLNFSKIGLAEFGVSRKMSGCPHALLQL